jgi:flagellar motor switch protein FliG
MSNEGLRNAAIVFSSLYGEQACAMLARLEPSVAAALLHQNPHISDVSASDRRAVVEKFMSEGQAVRTAGTEKSTSAVSRREKLASSRGQLEFLRQLGAPQLAALLADEHPQTVALILSRIPTPKAADVLGEFAPDEQAAIVARIAAMSQPSPEVIKEVSAGLRHRIDGSAARKGPIGLSKAVRMFHAMKPSSERAVLAHIAEADPNLLRELRIAMLGADVAASGDWEFAAAG